MRIAVAVLALLALAGCAERMADLTVVSTRNVDLARLNPDELEIRRNVEATDMRGWILFVPLHGEPNIEEAIDEALEAGDGDVMLNAVVYRVEWSCLFFTYQAWVVKGDVARIKPEAKTTVR